MPVRHLGGTPELAHVDVHDGGRGHTHLDLRYLFDAGDADPAPPADESQDVGWFGWDEAPRCRRTAVGRHPRRARRPLRLTPASRYRLVIGLVLTDP